MAAYRVLSLDGGGVRGLLTTVLLQRVLQQAGLARAFDRGNLDLIAGNSSGSLIALGMAHGLGEPMMLGTLEHTRLAFKDPERVFGKKWWWNTIRWAFTPKYGREARESALKELLGEQTTLGDFHHRVLITAVDLTGHKRQAAHDWKPKIFHNFEGKGSDKDREAWRVAMYSTAAITYFPVEDGFADGGVYGNNPSMCALAQLFDTRYGGETRRLEDVYLLSVGSGQNLSFLPRDGSNWGLINWAWKGRFVHLETDATVGIADYQCRKILPKNHYFRLAPDIPGRFIAIDAFKDVDFLERLVDQPAVADQIAECAQWMRDHWMPGLPPSTPVRPEQTSLHLRTATELTCRMPIKAGFLETLDTTTYATRLHAVLRTLQALRTASRELHTTRPIVDIVDAAKTVYGFSWEIEDEHQELVLTVHFDRPWEPYIRAIWKDLGPLLDLILCSCEGYVPSARGHHDFVRYVRGHQRPTGFFYPGSLVTVEDQDLVERLEKLQWDGVGKSLKDFDLAAASLIAPSVQDLAARDRALHPSDAREQWLAVLDALYALRRFFPVGTPDELLLRQSVRALLDWAPPGLPETPQVQWYRESAPRELPEAEPRPMDWDTVQAGIADRYRKISHGCVMLARIDDPEKARGFVGWLAQHVTRGSETHSFDDRKPPAIDGFNVAFTFSGLQQLAVPVASLGHFPKEFREGMEARAGLLGDIRENHPDNWNLPRRNVHHGVVDGDDVPSRVQNSTVDLVMILQAVADPDGQREPTAADRLYERVRKLCEFAWEHGVDVLSVEPMRRLRGRGDYGKLATRDHFGFIDGLSQPKVMEDPDPHHRDQVELGELFVGFRNQRKDPPFPEHCDDPRHCDRNSLIDSGSFLVIRKLRQHVDELHNTLKRAAADTHMPPKAILQHMMGRDTEGVPLVENPPKDPKHDNDFDYARDANGELCPFHAHIRRGNPRPEANDRVPRRAIPRIARRSLAFGPNYEPGDGAHRGIMFMAYNASIAEQFEIIQRWMSSGNTPTSSGGTGVFGGQSDPFLGLPDSDGKRTFRFRVGNGVQRIDLGPKPFVTLDWGLYLFVPSIPALKKLAHPPKHDDQANEEAVQLGEATMQLMQLSNTRDNWAALLEDLSANRSGTTRAVFAAISARHGGALRTPYGVLVTRKDLAMQVLTSDDDFSVCEYQHRFKQSVGKNYLGLDRGEEYSKASGLPNRILEAFPERRAFEAAYEIMHDELRKAIPPNTLDLVTVPLQPVIDTVIARLATRWFDLPDGRFMRTGGEVDEPHPARCPFDFLAPTRYVFSSPNPRPIVERLGRKHGKSILGAAEDFVNTGATLRGDIGAALQHEISDPKQLSHLLLGLMFGFVPTVYGNTLQVLEHWLEDRSLWRVQQRVRAANADPYVRASTTLRTDMERTLLADPLPLLLHRTAKVERKLGPVMVSPNDRVVLCMSGIGAESLASDGPDVALIFGGDRFDDPEHPTHACPGRRIATGAMLGILTALLDHELVPSRPPLTVQIDPHTLRNQPVSMIRVFESFRLQFYRAITYRRE
jgi:deferrochelatase/peroxidase EfeB